MIRQTCYIHLRIVRFIKIFDTGLVGRFTALIKYQILSRQNIRVRLVVMIQVLTYRTQRAVQQQTQFSSA